MPNILLVGPHQLVIHSLESLLMTKPTYTIFSQIINDDTTILKTNVKEEIQLIILDAKHNDTHDVALSHQLRKQYMSAKILILANEFSASHVRKLLATGINGYILKDNSSKNLFNIICQIFEGQEYYDYQVKNLLMQSYQPKGSKFKTNTPLTNREKEVVKYISEGFNVHEIAEHMIVSRSTIESHRKNIYTKLGLNKIALLVRYAIDQKIIE